MHRRVSPFRSARSQSVSRKLACVALFTSIGSVAGSTAIAQSAPNDLRRNAATCTGDSGGITVPSGFCATVFADNVGHARHLVVAPNGVVYVNTWSGKYYGNDTPPPGGFLLALQDTKGDGHADVAIRFGGTVATDDAGGTGIALYRNGLFAETNDRIVRYELQPGSIEPKGPAQTILSGLPLTGDHPMHPFAIDADGGLFVDLGSATNSCQKENRMPNSPGVQPCTELETRAGIWRYDANRTSQAFSPAERYVTGLRNGDGIAIDATGHGVFATQHGRDQLGQNWSRFYTTVQGANLPAEELMQLERGADYGWPECYFDDVQGKLVLAPEYGGDGGKSVGPCASKHLPIATFPAHWAPNDLAIYTAKQFPTAYRNGAFIAFHGSWNRAPLAQQGYNVVCSNRFRTARHRESTSSLLTVSPVQISIPAPPRIDLPVLPWGPMALSMFRMTRTAASGASLTRAAIQPHPLRLRRRRETHRAACPDPITHFRQRASTRMRARMPQANSCCLLAQRPSRSHWGHRFTVEQSEALRAQGVTAKPARALHWEPISPAANGCGVTAASLRSRRPSSRVCRRRRITRARCRRRAARICLRSRFPQYRHTSGLSGTDDNKRHLNRECVR